jgi:hypothetical protein
MSFNSAKVKALREESLRRGALASPRATPPVVLGDSGGEVIGGSGGGVMDFLMPGGGTASRVESMEDSEEEMFSDDAREVPKEVKTEKEGAVKLTFPICSGEIDLDEQWPWDICEGLIGGVRGSRFCTKLIEGTGLFRCKVASHANHKAELQSGHGYIPSVNDRANTEYAYLEPSVSSSRFPDSINDLADQALSHEEWIAFLTYLPTQEAMEESLYAGQEMAAEALEKSKLLVSFAVTPA